MSIHYLTHDGHKYSLSYPELKGHYIRFCEMSDEDFVKNAAKAAHLACIIMRLKEWDADYSIGDTGIVHELIHIISGTEHSGLARIREIFREYLELA